MDASKDKCISTQNNNQLDVMKLFFSGIVFLSHTETFIREDSRVHIPHASGMWGVFFFFIVSGMLMVNSYMCRPEPMGAVDATIAHLRKKAGKLFGLV